MQRLEYTVVEGVLLDNMQDFVALINTMILNGWELCGGVSSIGTASRVWPIQAMIKRDKSMEKKKCI